MLLYDRMHSFRPYESAAILSLFQTAEYIATMLKIATDFHESGGDINRGAAARLWRQRFPYHDNRQFSFILEEALRTIMGISSVIFG